MEPHAHEFLSSDAVKYHSTESGARHKNLHIQGICSVKGIQDGPQRPAREGEHTNGAYGASMITSESHSASVSALKSVVLKPSFATTAQCMLRHQINFPMCSALAITENPPGRTFYQGELSTKPATAKLLLVHL